MTDLAWTLAAAGIACLGWVCSWLALRGQPRSEAAARERDAQGLPLWEQDHVYRQRDRFVRDHGVRFWK